jgi:2-polyprenyl-6-hydroxyphenyl methylase / 3-demethylubiquinone-9 3-methyltransferase
MARIIDPEGREIRALARVARWRGARVLEVGCGDGRLTLRLARLGAKVFGVDPAASEIRSARQKLPKRYLNRIEYHVGTGTRLKQPSASFDVVLFSWSL